MCSAQQFSAYNETKLNWNAQVSLDTFEEAIYFQYHQSLLHSMLLFVLNGDISNLCIISKNFHVIFLWTCIQSAWPPRYYLICFDAFNSIRMQLRFFETNIYELIKVQSNVAEIFHSSSLNGTFGTSALLKVFTCFTWIPFRSSTRICLLEYIYIYRWLHFFSNKNSQKIKKLNSSLLCYDVILNSHMDCHA